MSSIHERLACQMWRAAQLCKAFPVPGFMLKAASFRSAAQVQLKPAEHEFRTDIYIYSTTLTVQGYNPATRTGRMILRSDSLLRHEIGLGATMAVANHHCNVHPTAFISLRHPASPSALSLLPVHSTGPRTACCVGANCWHFGSDALQKSLE